MPLSIERARKDAKTLCAAWRRRDKVAIKTVTRYFGPADEPSLSRAQLVIARNALYPSWKALLEARGVTQNDLGAAARLGDVAKTRELLGVLSPVRQLAVSICMNPLVAPEEQVVECLRLLFDAGCDPNAGVMFKGAKHSSLHGAREHGHELIAALLCERGGTLMPAPASS
ncbi:MAG: hypothetical protein Q8K63_03130 [Acidimicrobiales bacterium]|nr:hypothetical protein [Acidimicrobiales bacterium]